MKVPKKEKKEAEDMNIKEINENDNIVIYDIDKIDKIYKEIIEANEKIQILKQPSIMGNPLEVEEKKSTAYKLKNNISFYKKKKLMKIGNGETFQGNINEEKKEINKKQNIYISLNKGIYKWPSGEQYQGSFNKNNFFDGIGILSKKGKEEEYTFESEFNNGYPIKKCKFNYSKQKSYDLCIQSYIIKNENKNSPFRLILNGDTTITKSQDGKEIYRFDGEIINGKINGIATIKKIYKGKRYIEINLEYKKNERYNDVQELEMEANDKKDSFHYKGEYCNGLKVGNFTLKDIGLKEVNEESELYKIMKRLEKIIKGLPRKLIKTVGAKAFETLYRYNLPKLKLFNRIYKTKVKSNDQLIHIIHKSMDLDGMTYLCQLEIPNLKELALNNSGIKDISPLEKANFPLLESLSLGKNKIEKIDFINRLPFPKLKIIMLGFNIIKDVDPLEQYNSVNLKILGLMDNLISDITPLEKMNAPNLEQITIGAKINDINALTKCNFPKLKQLGLKGNKIKNISPLINANFPDLEILYLNNNEIVDLNPLKSFTFRKLSILGLDYNKIKRIAPLQYLKMDNLNYINISHNKFRPSSSDNRDIIDYLKRKIKDIKY